MLVQREAGEEEAREGRRGSRMQVGREGEVQRRSGGVEEGTKGSRRRVGREEAEGKGRKGLHGWVGRGEEGEEGGRLGRWGRQRRVGREVGVALRFLLRSGLGPGGLSGGSRLVWPAPLRLPTRCRRPAEDSGRGGV